jgi:hypothetical protein
MRELIVRDDRELRRVEQAIAAMESSGAGSKLGRQCLLAALVRERDELLRGLGRRPARQPGTGAGPMASFRATSRAA